MGKIWSVSAVSYVIDWRICPRCDGALGDAGCCPKCGADLTGPLGAQLAAASTRAAAALEERQRLVDRLRTVPVGAPAGTDWTDAYSPASPLPTVAAGATLPPARPTATATPALPGRPNVPRAPGAPAASSSQISVQSVLAVAGAGLLAVAALVFTFLNPELTSFAMRTLIIGVITIAFLGGAWLFARKGLQFSAEAVGALGAVFVVLDVWAFAQVSPAGVNEFVFAGIGTLVSSAALLILGARARVRSWVWAAVVGLALTPGLFGSAGGSVWSAVLGSLGVASAVLVVHVIEHRLAPRFGTDLGVERVTATIIQVVAVSAALLQLVLLDLPFGTPRVFGTAAILACLAIVTALGSQNGLTRFWSFSAGALGGAAIGILPFAVDLSDSVWYLALAPVASGAALVAVSALRRTPAVSRRALLSGAWTITLLTAAPALLLAVQQLASPPSTLAARALAGGGSLDSGYILPPTLGLATLVGVGAVAATLWGRGIVASLRGPREASVVLRARGLALWMTMLALLTLSGWSGLDPAVRAVVALGLAAALSLGLVWLRALSGLPAPLRRPLVVGTHLLLALAASIGWLSTGTMVWVGAAVVLVLAVLAQTTAARWRSVYFGIGYAYALMVVATALNLAEFETIAVLCLTTTLGLLFALFVTLTTWLSPRSWYATLIVTSAPFLIGIVAVLLVRSGWTALSTGIAFALALTLLTTRRVGMTVLLRAAAAALLVPALSVVVLCLGAQVLATSGSPVVLPVIAAIVACTFPASGLITAALRSRGISDIETDAACRWIEISALVTAALAVVLALVRIAAGLETTFLVLVILGVGAAATAFTTHRRFAWWTAGAAWTGALWCVWAIRGVDVLEPYLLPPALATLIVGAIFVARGRAGIAQFATGLAVAVVPSVVVLAVAGSSLGPTAAWRSLGLLAASLLLIALSALVAGHSGWARWRPLILPTVVIATIAAAAGAVQAVRWGLGLDTLMLSVVVMVPVLLISAVAMVLAAASAYVLGVSGGARDVSPATGQATAGAAPATSLSAAVPSRWRYAAATAFLVAGPITAIRPDPFSIATLMVLTLGLLGFMLVVVARARTLAVSLPPAAFLFALAWATAVAGWSERELRVEAFSLPLGLTLIGAGIIALRPGATAGDPSGIRSPALRAWTRWPNGFTGSWRLLTPGIIVTFLPSVLATGTDPQTWRAILVLTLALTAILLGSVFRLAAPFVLSLAVLPIEIIVVFMVQIGRTINPLLWWITLATAGAVLLVIAITSERKGAAGSGISARMRDLT